ncbi:MAG: aminoacyl--tRNA ligase-related protein [Patescibacteria group bacterium]|nr:aminoacyl--tRNA ligase-related protein [Patescibacteria group bacterium]
MRYSKLFPKARREVKAESINHRLLVQAGFMDQLMAGSWTLLPLGWRVVNKINNIIREEINKVDGQEILMPLLHPKSIWNETGRWDKADEIMYKLKDQRGREYVLSFTHEEIVMDILRKQINSYKDLPVAVYHFSTKFRNELRARSGILRGREFMMKDLYSAHVSEEDLMDYYFKVLEAYKKIFDKLGFNYRVTEADGGVFTDKNTHEVQVLSQAGEDTIYYCDQCDWGANGEIYKFKQGNKCPKCRQGKVIEAKSIEVANIFPLGTMYAEKMKVFYTDKNGKKKPVWFGSYGIGPTRVMGTYAEVFNDDKGLIWPEAVAPYKVYLIGLKGGEKKAKDLYKKLSDLGIEVLWDDRDESAGIKFKDADLIGCPIRLVISKKTAEKVEWKNRTSEKQELLTSEQVVAKLK